MCGRRDQKMFYIIIFFLITLILYFYYMRLNYYEVPFMSNYIWFIILILIGFQIVFNNVSIRCNISILIYLTFIYILINLYHIPGYYGIDSWFFGIQIINFSNIETINNNYSHTPLFIIYNYLLINLLNLPLIFLQKLVVMPTFVLLIILSTFSLTKQLFKENRFQMSTVLFLISTPLFLWYAVRFTPFVFSFVLIIFIMTICNNIIKYGRISDKILFIVMALTIILFHNITAVYLLIICLSLLILITIGRQNKSNLNYTFIFTPIIILISIWIYLNSQIELLFDKVFPRHIQGDSMPTESINNPDFVFNIIFIYDAIITTVVLLVSILLIFNQKIYYKIVGAVMIIPISVLIIQQIIGISYLPSRWFFFLVLLSPIAIVFLFYIIYNILNNNQIIFKKIFAISIFLLISANVIIITQDNQLGGATKIPEHLEYSEIAVIRFADEYHYQIFYGGHISNKHLKNYFNLNITIHTNQESRSPFLHKTYDQEGNYKIIFNDNYVSNKIYSNDYYQIIIYYPN